MDLEHLTGMERTIETVVDRPSTASAVGSGGVDVLATPSMILLFEQAARDAVQAALPEGYTTVGTAVNVQHLSATPVGGKVTVRAVVEKVDGRRIHFRVTAVDRHGTAGKGTHERFAVNLKNFMEKLSRRNTDGIG